MKVPCVILSMTLRRRRLYRIHALHHNLPLLPPHHSHHHHHHKHHKHHRKHQVRVTAACVPLHHDVTAPVVVYAYVFEVFKALLYWLYDDIFNFTVFMYFALLDTWPFRIYVCIIYRVFSVASACKMQKFINLCNSIWYDMFTLRTQNVLKKSFYLR